MRNEFIKAHLVWSGIGNRSLENCIVNVSNKEIEISSTIIGVYNEKICQVNYRIKTNLNWETVYFESICHFTERKEQLRLESDGKGTWKINSNKSDAFNGCIDIDIPLTPFTNTLPLRRLSWRPGQSREIDIFYCDLLQGQVMHVKQRYTCLSNGKYHYENVPNDFESSILVDEFGFVVDYPKLFNRSAAVIKTNS